MVNYIFHQTIFGWSIIKFCTFMVTMSIVLTQSILLAQSLDKFESTLGNKRVIPEVSQPSSNFSRILSEEPSLRLQESIVYLDESGVNWVIPPPDPSGKTRVRWKGLPVRMIPPPSHAGMVFGTCYGQGALWCTVASDVTKTLALFRCDLDLPGNGWEKVGVFDGEGGIPSLVVPLKRENQFLGFSSFGLREPASGRASFVGIFRNNKEKLSLESNVDIPFGDISNIVKGEWFNVHNPGTENSSVPQDRDGVNRFWMGYADPYVLKPTLRPPSHSNDYLVLGAASAGMLWIFDLNTGQLHTTINLIGLGLDDISKVKPLEHVILGTGFTPDGDLIVAGKDKNLVKMVVGLDLDNLNTNAKDLRMQDFDFFVKEIKEIRWWRIDPKTGIKKQLDSPIDFPEQMPSSGRHPAFRFLVDPFGHVKTNAFRPWSKVIEDFLTSFVQKADGAKAVKNDESSSRINKLKTNK